MSFRMTAAMTTLEGFPAALSRAANAFIPGSQRNALSAAM